ncbi:hypothetical protein [Sphingomonas sp. 1185]|uniref:hypothetical protein n=1 Tax=Sphingomonas sp. 1185 TaxID=3156411 RepID=UPI003396735A
MSGLFSQQPGQGAIRLLVGSHGLLLVQSILTSWGGVDACGPRLIAALATVIAAPALICALVGDGADHDHPWRRRDAR